MLLGEFKIQAGVNMYSQLHDYDNTNGFDLPKEMQLAASPEKHDGGVFETFLANA